MQHEAGNGFTLIELLVAIVLLAMIFTMVFGTFFYTINSAEQQEERAAIYHRVNFILNNLSQNMSSAYVPLFSALDIYNLPDPPPVFFGENLQIGDAEADSFSAYTSNARFGGRVSAGEIDFVSYSVLDSQDVAMMPDWLKDENNPLVLEYTVDPLVTQPTGLGWTQNIRSLNLEYSDGAGGWPQEWSYQDLEALPEAVRIKLEVADSDGEIYAFTTIVRVHVNTLIEDVPKKP